VAVTWEEAREAAQAHFGEAAFNHSLRTAETAAILAGIYGVDPHEARLAGLLHDWHRELSAEELEVAAAEDGIELTSVYRTSPRLLHAETGARAVARELPQLSAAVLSAIAKHTVGAAQMSPLDEIVYVADMIEDGRVYGGVDDLREAVGSVSLDELFAMAYQQTVMHVVKTRRPIHPVTLEVWNTMVARTQR
jgi:predicted HD superfamily hydrolase involved in NAD metabolism